MATDHAPHTLAEKEDRAKCPSGQPHLDTYGPFVTWLIIEQGFAPERIAAVCCANPGDFVNPYVTTWEKPPLRFGRIEPGLHGLANRLEPQAAHSVRREDLKTKCGWSPFEGVTFPGSVEAVFLRGRRSGLTTSAVKDVHGAFDHLEPGFRKELDRLGVSLAFGLKDACGQRLRRIPLKNRDGLLHDDGSVIVKIIREMNGAAADLYSPGQCRPVHLDSVETFAAERGDQRIVDVHRTVGKVVWDAD